MKEFLSDNFLLDNKTSEILYFDYAKGMPIIDYHNHLPPQEIAENRQFDNLTQIWLNDDHYKCRAMRSVGIDEKYITGDATDKEKFIKWAETLPHTLRNPLYYWTHLELQRYFGINTLLNIDTATAIYEKNAQKFQKPDFRVHDMDYMMNVEVVCTTDNSLDDLQYHKKNTSEVKVLPTFRLDKAMNVQNTIKFNKYLKTSAKYQEFK